MDAQLMSASAPSPRSSRSPPAAHITKKPRLEADSSITAAADRVARADSSANDALAALRRELQTTADPHLQAKLLLRFSEQAAAPDATTEHAIDFLFSFLQQAQDAAASAARDIKQEPQGSTSTSTSSNGGGSGNAVIVGAIVRGLHGLLAVKPRVVEPMVQVDAMSEQLVQCVSVPEDFKLRRDMARLVLACLLRGRRHEEALHLLSACVDDHDDGLRGICLDGYLALVDAGQSLPTPTVSQLLAITRALLLRGAHSDAVRIRSARLLGVIAAMPDASESQAVADSVEVLSLSPSLSRRGARQTRVAHTLAAAARDASSAVRREVAAACRQLCGAEDDTLAQLLVKQPISEDLTDVATQNEALMTSGAVLTLLEDDEEPVTTETARTIRVLCQTDAWPLTLLDRVASALLEAATRWARHRDAMLTVLESLKVVLAARGTHSDTGYIMSGEEMAHFLGSVSAQDVLVVRAVVAVLEHCDVASISTATRLVTLVLSLPSSASASGSIRVVHLLATQLGRVGSVMKHQGIVLPPDLVDQLRSAATSHDSHARVLCCRGLVEALLGEAGETTGIVNASSGIASVPFLPRVTSHQHRTPVVLTRQASAVPSPLEQLQQVLRKLHDRVRREPLTSADSRALASIAMELLPTAWAVLARCNAVLDNAARADLMQLAITGWLARLLTERDSIQPTELLCALQSSTLSNQLNACAPHEQARWLPLRELESSSASRQELEAVFLQTLQSLCGKKPMWLLEPRNRTRWPPRMASAVLLSPESGSDPQTVCSKLPFRLVVKCRLHYASDLSRVFIKVRMPHGEVVYKRVALTEWRTMSASTHEAESTLVLRFTAFSDPTSFSVTVCLQPPPLLSPFAISQALLPSHGMEVTNDVDLCAAVECAVSHRAAPALRHHGR